MIGWLLAISGLLALGCNLVGMIATHFDPEAFSNPVKLLSLPDVDPFLIRLFMILDLFGYYLLLLPFIFFAHKTMADKTPWSAFLSSMGYAYVFIGAIGAASLAVIWPNLINQFHSASGVSQEIIRADFSLATDFVVKGLWNHLEVLLGGVWWIGLGIFFFEGRSLKIMSILLGGSCIIDGFGELLVIPALAEIGLNLYLVLGIIWPIWAGIAMVKDKSVAGQPVGRAAGVHERAFRDARDA
jgi:hypothetical protein